MVGHQLQDAHSSFTPGILKSKRNDPLLAFLFGFFLWVHLAVLPLGEGLLSGAGETLAGCVSIAHWWAPKLASLLLFPIFSFLFSETFIHCLYILGLLPQHMCISISIYPVISSFFHFFKKQNYGDNTLQMSENVLL